jgi:hypothetical protein
VDEHLLRRFETYFQHNQLDHDVLKIGDKALSLPGTKVRYEYNENEPL